MRLTIKDKLLARLGLGSIGLALLAAGIGSPASASAACPNEAVRAQQGVSTLLGECRGYELVTPVEKNDEELLVPKDTTGLEVQDQASATGAGSSFAMTGGIPGSESAGEFTDGVGTGSTPGSAWADLSLAPETRFGPIGTAGPRNGGQMEYYSPELACGVEKTALALAKVPGEAMPERAPGESLSEEIDNLYVWTAPPGIAPSESARGTYTLVTSDRPSDPGASNPYGGGGYRVGGVSEGCGHVAFENGSVGYELPVTPSSSEYSPLTSLYEWSAATGPRLASVLPDGKPASGLLAVQAGEKSSDYNELSADGSTLFFTASSDESKGPEAAGDEEVYARINGESTVEVSATETGTADNGARFQAASKDGHRVFFLANYGLTTVTSTGSEAPTECQFQLSVSVPAGEGCDLYEYDNGKLTDLSADTGATGDKKGANARGVVGISADGSYVYFSAGGQLIAGKGNSGAVNEAEQEANVYAYHEGHLSYVATIGEAEAGGGKAGIQSEQALDALSPGTGHGLTFLMGRVSPSGQYLLLASYKKLTEYNNIDSGTGKPDPELYEYRYTEGAPAINCASCSPSGTQPISAASEAGKPFSPLGVYIEVRSSGSIPRNLLDDGRVFFDSYTPLVTQEPETTHNVHAYEWQPGGVNGCATAAGCVSLLDPGTSTFPTYFTGASEDGENVYISTPQSLAPQDEDGGLRDLYDLRVDGGILKTPSAEPCSINKDTCQVEGERFNESPITSSTTASNEPELKLVVPQTPTSTSVPVKITGHSAGRTTFTLVISLPAAGSVTVSGSGIAGLHKSEARAGTYKLTILLSSKTRAAIKHHKRVKVSVRVAFKSTSGSSSTASLAATLK